MQPTTEILEKISQNSMKHHDEVFTRVFRYMLRKDIYYVAYQKLYANNGASTKGIDEDTADGFSEKYIEKIIKKLSDNTFMPKPTRRISIPKANGKMRPISIPCFTDKLVQEVMRMILEAIYEPIFSNNSHGFRPKRSCHTALEQLRNDFTGVKWFVEGDIKGCFDNIDHQTLVSIISKKIKDARFIQLLYKFLKSGYLEDWKYHNTYSGAPQGGIISPILANIYLNELDKHIADIKKEFDKPRERAYDPAYSKCISEIRKINIKLSKCTETEKDLLVKQKQAAEKRMRTLPCISKTDKRLAYIRYADDFIIGIVGNHEDSQEVKRNLTAYIKDVLKMELSAEKTLITYSNTPARFLGYDIRVRRSNQLKRTKSGRLVRTLNNKIERKIPIVDKIEKFLFEKRIIYKKGNKLTPCKRPQLMHLPDLEILMTYNAELRGICNYYNLASNFCDLHYFSYLMEYSCLKTLAAKHKTSIAKIIDQYRSGKGWSIPYKTKKGEQCASIAKHSDCKGKTENVDIIPNTGIKFLHSRNSFESRLNAHKCELCGTTDSENYEIHHIKKVKDLKGKEAWERIMLSRRRKTLVVCRECHKRIHGKKND